MPYCSNCGAEVPENISFCENCGAKTDEEAEKNKKSGSKSVDAKPRLELFSQKNWKELWEKAAKDCLDCGKELGIVLAEEKGMLKVFSITKDQSMDCLGKYLVHAAARGVVYYYLNADSFINGSGSYEPLDLIPVLTEIVNVARPKYLMLFGDGEHIAPACWENQSCNLDEQVESDMAYSLLDGTSPWEGQKFNLAQALRVGRIPYYDGQSFESYWSYFENAMRGTGTLDELKTFGLSVFQWEDTSKNIYEDIKNKGNLYMSPKMEAGKMALFIHGNKGSAESNMGRAVVEALGDKYNFILPTLDLEDVERTVFTLKSIIANEDVEFVAATSLGCFYLFALLYEFGKDGEDEKVGKLPFEPLIINPCLLPSEEIPPLAKDFGQTVNPDTIKAWKKYEEVIYKRQPAMIKSFFADDDELFGFKYRDFVGSLTNLETKTFRGKHHGYNEELVKLLKQEFFLCRDCCNLKKYFNPCGGTGFEYCNVRKIRSKTQKNLKSKICNYFVFDVHLRDKRSPVDDYETIKNYMVVDE
ncbi:MAG: zinc ribbon domain-containing protein [Treponema sp.]|nr:zinc ribbon domain-containing protein [Candidatus Treponema equifaecale]